jgi:ABC-type amino acid transport substrate-binding protein
VFYSHIANAHPHDTDTLKRREFKSITIAAEPDYPPYCIIDDEGNPDGFSVELFLAAAEAVGIRVDIHIGIWDKIKQDLADGRIDALPFVGRTPEREPLYDFTLPYLSLHGAIFAKKNTKSIKTLEDIKPLRVAVMKGDNAEEYVKRENLADHLIATYTYEEAFRMLKNNEVDAVVAQRIMGIELLKRMGIKNIAPLEIQLPNFRQDFCFAVQEGNTELLSRLNEGLSIVFANKKFDEIHLKWFGPSKPIGYTLQDLLRIVLYILIPLIFLIIIFVISLLRKQVKVRTAELSQEIEGHKKTLMALNNQQLLFEKVEEVALIGGWEYSFDLDKVVWTNGLYRVFEVDPNTFDSSSLEANYSLFNEESRKILEQAIENAFKHNKPYDIELKITTPKGNSKWVWSSGQPEVIDGKVVRIYGSLMDVSDRKSVEENLRNERQRFKQILDEFPLGIHIVDKDYNMEFLNSRMVKEFGKHNGELCYEYLYNLNSPCKNCNHDKVIKGEACVQMWKSDKNGKLYEVYDIPLNNVDGTISRLEVFLDITDKKAAENELLDLKNSLEEKVIEKTKELNERIVDLERFHEATINREIRMKELKEEIKRLKGGV